ncbi:MAG: hypothetical protein J0I48_06785 [Devosia sp.]|uniref:hypothetical protein n=1 Tax=Devosia sp. 66-22 TaxID=1895753 RepID=UPI000929BBE4|nr:hypothetical protein [Devosia sp. 66-22]MBN9345898.1 hypothetical protein [Devosia sp.]OJX49712.1 MAG: hypothetical protein BGO81_19280 [Devosia sp. 66-22]
MTTSTLPPPTTAEYRSRSPQHNARVFIAAWRYTIIGVDDLGLFAFDVNRDEAELLDIRELAVVIGRSDTHGRLSAADALDAAAMVFHFSPANWLTNDRA